MRAALSTCDPFTTSLGGESARLDRRRQDEWEPKRVARVGHATGIAGEEHRQLVSGTPMTRSVEQHLQGL
ncbi:hypothetical protein C8Q78DRAFT_1014238 [Trametes maxima]|nr:hypothetical protein C8Q78DRAFT_1014238 [Trametes maxima]